MELFFFFILFFSIQKQQFFAHTVKRALKEEKDLVSFGVCANVRSSKNDCLNYHEYIYIHVNLTYIHLFHGILFFSTFLETHVLKMLYNLTYIHCFMDTLYFLLFLETTHRY